MIGKKIPFISIAGTFVFLSLYGCGKKEVSENVEVVNREVVNEEGSATKETKKEVVLPEKMTAAEYYNYGLESIKKGGFDDAIAAWEKALELEPTMVNAYEKLAKAYYTQARFDKAGAIYRKELELTPDDPMIY